MVMNYLVTLVRTPAIIQAGTSVALASNLVLFSIAMTSDCLYNPYHVHVCFICFGAVSSLFLLTLVKS